MPVGSAKAGAVRVESRDLYKLTKDLQQVDKKLAVEMKRQMRILADPLVRAVQKEADFSKRIPKATKASTRFTARTQALIVTVNRKQAPHARPINNDGKEGWFTHPIPVRAASTRRGRLRQAAKGDQVKQRANPFFARAIKSKDYRIDKAIDRVAEDFEKRIGF